MEEHQQSEKIGFESSNFDQNERAKKQQELVNKHVLSKQLKVLSMPNTEKKSVKDLALDFLKEVVCYENQSDIDALAWVRGAGGEGGKTNFRAEMSCSFWSYFMEKGKQKLNEYNRKHKTRITVKRERTLSIGDLDNLSLYLRKKIKQYCINQHIPMPEISVKNGYMNFHGPELKEEKKIKSTILAVRLGWEYADWSGIPIKELLTANELKEYNDGKLKWGSLTLPSFLSMEPVESISSPEITNEKERNSRKRDATGEESGISSKLPRNEMDNNE